MRCTGCYNISVIEAICTQSQQATRDIVAIRITVTPTACTRKSIRSTHMITAISRIVARHGKLNDVAQSQQDTKRAGKSYV